MIIQGFIKVCFLRNKDDTAEHFMKYFVDIAPCKVDMARSDGGGRLRASLGPCVAGRGRIFLAGVLAAKGLP